MTLRVPFLSMQLRLRLLHKQPKQCLLTDQHQMSDQHKQQEQLHWMEGQQLTHRSSGIPCQDGAMPEHGPTPSSSSPWLPESPKAGQAGYFSGASGGPSSSSTASSSTAGALHRLGSAAAALTAADPDCTSASHPPGGTHVLQKLIAERLGLLPTEEAKQMLHYVIPQVAVCCNHAHFESMPAVVVWKSPC